MSTLPTYTFPTSTFLFFIISISIFAIFAIISIYNNIIRKDKLSTEAWHGIDIQLKRRYDLLPSLVETVKGYAKHEKQTLEDIVSLRNSYQNTATIDEKSQDASQMSGMLKTVFALAENYPDLKANQNFIELQKSIEEIEEQIQLSRRYYNANIRDFNTLICMFPINLIAKKFNFKEKEFFGIENENEKENIKVSF